MHSNAREATSSHDQEEHPYGELLHLLHVLRYLVSGSATLLVDRLIAQFVDMVRRERMMCCGSLFKVAPLLRLD
jgi:hypothetical protein